MIVALVLIVVGLVVLTKFYDKRGDPNGFYCICLLISFGGFEISAVLGCFVLPYKTVETGRVNLAERNSWSGGTYLIRQEAILCYSVKPGKDEYCTEGLDCSKVVVVATAQGEKPYLSKTAGFVLHPSINWWLFGLPGRYPTWTFHVPPDSMLVVEHPTNGPSSYNAMGIQDP